VVEAKVVQEDWQQWFVYYDGADKPSSCHATQTQAVTWIESWTRRANLEFNLTIIRLNF